VIIDLDKFVKREEPLWQELARMLDQLGRRGTKLDLDGARRLHYLYERASAALAKISTYSSDAALVSHLEDVVARAYAQIHSMGPPRPGFSPIKWFFGTFPRAFRQHFGAFVLSLAVTLAGVAFGAYAVAVDPQAKGVILPFGHAEMDPKERVRQEESGEGGRHGGIGVGGHAAFASMLMTHNIMVSILAFALGLTWGVGTLVLLFYNGVILGALCLDYIRAGEGVFLAGWLLPHGSIEIPAVLLAGQAGLVLAGALVGRGDANPLKIRLRQALPSVATLVVGLAIMLVWAGIVESFFSQYHWPVLPYWLKIVFGGVELALLTAFLALSGRRGMDVPPMSFSPDHRRERVEGTHGQDAHATHGQDAHATRRPQE
jgi:uncharacterized membrane protein SpoIIM required for sporulation